MAATGTTVAETCGVVKLRRKKSGCPRHVGVVSVCARYAALIGGFARHWEPAVLASDSSKSGCLSLLLLGASDLVGLSPTVCRLVDHLRLLFARGAGIDNLVLKALGSCPRSRGG